MLKRLLFMLVVFSWLTACGGGGGGGSDATTTLPVEYTGSTTQATVTTSNARTVSSSAYSGVQITSSFNVLGKTNSDSDDHPFLLQEVASVLESCVSVAALEQKSTGKTVGATSTDQNTIYGYSGSYQYNISVDTSTGATSGTIRFYQYKQTSSSITMTGLVVISGVFNQSTAKFTKLNMIIECVVTSGSTSITMSGSNNASVSGATKTYTMTMAITDNVSHRTTVMKDYTLTLTGNSLTVTGTYYYPTYGYVVISTETPLTVSSLSATPTAGRLIFTGSNGTKARLTFASNGSYIIEADTTGSGSYVTVP